METWRWVAGGAGAECLIILTDRSGGRHLYHQRSAGAAPREITSGEWEIASFEVDAAKRQFYFVANKSYMPERQLYRVALAGGAVQRISPETAGTNQPVWSPDFRHVASQFSSDTMPPELTLIDTAKPGRAPQVTKSPQPEFYAPTWRNPGYFQFPRHIHGLHIPVIITVT